MQADNNGKEEHLMWVWRRLSYLKDICSKFNRSALKMFSKYEQRCFILCSFSNLSVTSPTSAHSSTHPSLYLRHSSFSNPSVASPTSQYFLQPLFRFSYVLAFHLRHLASCPWITMGRMSCDIVEATEGLENELWRR